MNTEKNSPTKENNSPAKENNSPAKENNFSKLLLSIKGRISEHRLAIRSAIKSKPLNVITIASILPFFLGFYYFINQNQQVKKILFQKNLPTFSIPTESLNWETFRYFSKTKKDFSIQTHVANATGLEIEKIEWSTNSLFLTKSLNKQFLFTKNKVYSKNEKYFIASFNNPIQTNEKFLSTDMPNIGSNRFYLNSWIKQPNLPLFQTFYLNLDQVPLKLDNLTSYDMFTRVRSKNFSFRTGKENGNKSVLINNQDRLSITQNLPFHQTFWIKNNSFSNQSIKKINSQNLLVEVNGIKNIPVIKKITNNKLSNTSSSNNSFLEKQTSWFLEKALKNYKIYSTSFFSISDDINTIEGTLLDLEQILSQLGFSWDSFYFQKSNTFLNVNMNDSLCCYRRMSGYQYPDMNSKQVNNFLLHNLCFYLPKNIGLLPTTQNSLKIIFPANPSFLKQFSFSNSELPTKFNIKVGTGTIKNWDQNKNLYNDISVFLDLKNGLDWEFEKIESSFKKSNLFIPGFQFPTNSFLETGNEKEGEKKRQKNLRFWFENYLSPLNPLIHSKDSINGMSFTSRNFLFSKDDESRLVPFFTENKWKELYNQNKISQIFLDDYIVNGSSLPVIDASLLNIKYKYPRLNFIINSTVDHLYVPQNFATKIKPSSSGGFLVENMETKKEFFNDTFTPVHYKKIMSIFHKPQFDSFSFYKNFLFGNEKEKIFSDSWEPLNFRSWLIVSQIGLAFLFFNFLKSIMSDYFKELISFIIDFGMATGIFDENIKEQIELATGQRDKGFRIISKSKKKFQNIAGIKTLLPEIAEIVWFLRNSGKKFSLSKNVPRGLLLIGPPGTGKTVLVQALAGEAQVPVLVLSGSSLISPGESGAVKLEFLFQEARQLAPCIVFIDEIDTLALKRQDVMQNPMGGDEVLSALVSFSSSKKTGKAIANTSLDLGESTSKDFLKTSQTSFFKKTDQIESITRNSTEVTTSSAFQFVQTEKEIKQKINTQQKYQQEQLSLLVQLLIELDGLQGRKGVVVIGATNIPELLDPAILRPGRFDKILELGLPSHEKRLEIFKLYGEILGYDPNISWEYFSKRTVGFTAADLTSIMNQSCLKAILNDTKHTLLTIEHGIDRITTSEIEKPSKEVETINRIAYYQAGKLVLSTVLEHHPSTLVTYLWPRYQNRRSLQILTNLQKYFFQFARRCEIEDRIIGSYGGKAAEILFLQNSSVNFSSYGLEDLSFAFVLVCFTIEKWYLYSKSTLITQLTQLISNKNSKEFIPEKVDFFRELAYFMELPPHLLYSHETDTPLYPLSQNFFSTAWWQLNISQELEFVERNFSDWYRLYLPNPEETELNIEWSPPDEFYHRNLLNKQVNNSSITWNDLHNVVRDYQVHSFVLESFNKALCLLDENREYLDKIVFELLKKEVLREPEIDKLASSFISFSNTSVVPFTFPVVKEKETKNRKIQNSNFQQTSTIKIVNNSFGEMSRRKIKNWIDFKEFEN